MFEDSMRPAALRCSIFEGWVVKDGAVEAQKINVKDSTMQGETSSRIQRWALDIRLAKEYTY
jgi:hypothetical protein